MHKSSTNNTQYKSNQNSQSYTDSAAKIDLATKTDTVYLWPPYGIGQAIIFLPCGFFLLLFFFSPNLSGRSFDVYHTSTHGVALVRI